MFKGKCIFKNLINNADIFLLLLRIVVVSGKFKNLKLYGRNTYTKYDDRDLNIFQEIHLNLREAPGYG